MPETSVLVDLSVIFPSLHIDLKYATRDNITGAPVYREARWPKASALRSWRA